MSSILSIAMSIPRRCFNKWVWTNFPTKENLLQDQLKLLFRPWTLLTMRPKFTPIAAVVNGVENTNTSALVSVSKIRSVAIMDLAGAKQMEGLTSSLACIHSESDTSIFWSRKEASASIDENVTDQSLLEHSCPIHRKRDNCMLHVKYQVFYYI